MSSLSDRDDAQADGTGGRASVLRRAVVVARRVAFGRIVWNLVGTTLGLISACVLTFATAVVFVDATTAAGSATVWVLPLFLATWLISATLLLKNARRFSTTVARAFLLGAAEALLLIPVGVAVTSKLVPAGFERGGIEGRWIAIQAAGAAWVVIAGVALLVSVFCLLGYLVTALIRREVERSADTDLSTASVAAQR